MTEGKGLRVACWVMVSQNAGKSGSEINMRSEEG